MNIERGMRVKVKHGTCIASPRTCAGGVGTVTELDDLTGCRVQFDSEAVRCFELPAGDCWFAATELRIVKEEKQNG